MGNKLIKDPSLVTRLQGWCHEFLKKDNCNTLPGTGESFVILFVAYQVEAIKERIEKDVEKAEFMKIYNLKLAMNAVPGYYALGFMTNDEKEDTSSDKLVFENKNIDKKIVYSQKRNVVVKKETKLPGLESQILDLVGPEAEGQITSVLKMLQDLGFKIISPTEFQKFQSGDIFLEINPDIISGLEIKDILRIIKNKSLK
ncbi:MAG: hypothetical protein NT068_04175 [Candidatus Nomurabacteria bacterium]|nr:hypothetical protein [Candidatus Nomurabacteria bacterium]